MSLRGRTEGVQGRDVREDEIKVLCRPAADNCGSEPAEVEAAAIEPLPHPPLIHHD
jgi:hypothetical protein